MAGGAKSHLRLQVAQGHCRRKGRTTDASGYEPTPSTDLAYDQFKSARRREHAAPGLPKLAVKLPERTLD